MAVVTIAKVFRRGDDGRTEGLRLLRAGAGRVAAALSKKRSESAGPSTDGKSPATARRELATEPVVRLSTARPETDGRVRPGSERLRMSKLFRD